MREIKFRAWNTENQKMVDLHAMTPLALDAGMNTQLAMRGDSGLFIPFMKGIEVMQFTGLKDKNGVEIYEGDILQFLDTCPGCPSCSEDVDDYLDRFCPNCGSEIIKREFIKRGQIVFHDCEFKATWLEPDEEEGAGQWYGPLYNRKEPEVIGNIHQNPELLQERP